MKRLLTNHSIRSVENCAMRLRSRDWLVSAYATLGRTAEHNHPSEARNEISRDEFMAEFYSRNRALFLPGIAAAWPAVARWKAEYLDRVCGGEMVEVMMNRSTAPAPEQNSSNKLRHKMLFRDYVKKVFAGGPSNDYYMASRNGFFEQPNTRGLLEDLGTLPFVDTRAPGAGVKMWFGPAGTITPLHHDDRNNVIVQIVGRKAVRLYPSACAPQMKQTTLWFAGTDPGISGPPTHRVMR